MLPLLKKNRKEMILRGPRMVVKFFLTSFVKIDHLVQMFKDTNTQSRELIDLLSFTKKRD